MASFMEKIGEKLNVGGKKESHPVGVTGAGDQGYGHQQQVPATTGYGDEQPHQQHGQHVPTGHSTGYGGTENVAGYGGGNANPGYGDTGNVNPEYGGTGGGYGNPGYGGTESGQHGRAHGGDDAPYGGTGGGYGNPGYGGTESGQHGRAHGGDDAPYGEHGNAPHAGGFGSNEPRVGGAYGSSNVDELGEKKGGLLEKIKRKTKGPNERKGRNEGSSSSSDED